MEIFITLTKYYIAGGVKTVTAASGDYLAYIHPLKTVSKVFLMNGENTLMFRSKVYNKYIIRSSTEVRYITNI